jgi:hypothetical protein
MRALAGVFAHSYPDFQAALLAAERGEQAALVAAAADDDEALTAAEGSTRAALRLAHELLDRLPALNRRRLLASYADMASFRPVFKVG